MKTNFYQVFLCLSLTFIFSCTKDNLIPDVKKPVYSSPHSFTGRDTIHCDDDQTFEYDITNKLYDGELLTIEGIQRLEVGDSLYNLVLSEMEKYFDDDFETWYFKFFDEYPNEDVVEEIENIETFIDENYNGRYFGSLVDSLVDSYIDDNRFDLMEKNLLSSSILSVGTLWQISKCNSGLTPRGGDDGYLCFYAHPDFDDCEALQFYGAFGVGYLIGYAADQALNHTEYWSRTWTPIVLGILAAIFTDNSDPLNCKPECDDCHHPEKITLKADYVNCRYSAAQWFGTFEYAEAWDYRVFVESGNFSGETFVPRQPFPSNFDPDGEEFTVNIRTVCDGHEYPEPVEGFDQVFGSNLPPTPLSLRGAIIANKEDDFIYISSTNFGGNLSNPVWDVSEGVETISSGVDGDKYYIVVNFAEVEDPRAEITLTVYDDCSDKNITTIFPPRLEHE